jgi:peptidoglycan-associated lipoprotein
MFACALVVAATIGVWGCQNKATPKSVPETRPASEVDAASKSAPPPPREITQPAAEPFPQTDVDKTTLTTPTIDELNRQGVLRTVYFGYNSEDLDDAGKAVLQANATWLKSNPAYTVEVGGHCDERGSIGYNVALGDRRAASVKDYLAGLGVTATQLVSVSYGEERPAQPGHDEASWSKNRRAEFVIQP